MMMMMMLSDRRRNFVPTQDISSLILILKPIFIISENMKRRSITQKEHNTSSEKEKTEINFSDEFQRQLLDELSEINKKTTIILRCEKMMSSLIRCMSFMESKLDKLDVLDDIHKSDVLTNIDHDLETIYQRLDDQLDLIRELQKKLR